MLSSYTEISTKFKLRIKYVLKRFVKRAPAHPRFTKLKWGIRRFKLHGHVIVMLGRATPVDGLDNGKTCVMYGKGL